MPTNPYVRSSTSGGAGLYRLYNSPGTPTAVQAQGEDDGGGFKFGLGTLFDELKGAGSAIASLGPDSIGGLEIPGMGKGPGWGTIGEGMLSSLAGTGMTIASPLTDSVRRLSGGDVDLGKGFSEWVGRTLGDNEAEDEVLRPKDFFQKTEERGLLPALFEDIGNVSLVAGAATAPVKGASAAARVLGATETSARLAATHASLIANPAIAALQHPYITAGKWARRKALAPAADRVLAASGAVDLPENMAPIDYLAAELPDTGVDYQKVQVDMNEHAARARAYEDLPDVDPEAAPFYDAFANETAEQYRHLTEDVGLSFEFVDEVEPYATHAEMLDDVRTNKRLRVAKTTDDAHPYLTPDQNDQFRAVHDIYGHAATARDFSRHGEEAAFLAHRSMYGDDAGRAMASETRGQNAVLIDTGEFGAQKAALLPDGLDDPTAAVAKFQKAPATPVGNVTKGLARAETWLRGWDTAKVLRNETRMADMERAIAARSPAVRAAKVAARDFIIDAGKEKGLTIGRKEASLIVGGEVKARLTGVKALEDMYIERGVPQEMILRTSPVRERFIPKELLDNPDLQIALAAAVDAQKIEHGKVRDILASGRKGDQGLDGLSAEDADAPALTKADQRLLDQADKHLKRAESEVLARKIAREEKGRRNFVASEQDKIARIAEQSRRIDSDLIPQQVRAFEHTRTLVPRAWRSAGAMEASAQALFDETIANVTANGGDFGGGTFDPHTGRLVKGGEGSGFAVAVVQGTALEIPVEQFTPESIVQVITEYQDLFQHPGTTIGTWISDGKAYIDPGEVIAARPKALIRAAARAQLEVFDVAANDTVVGILQGRPDVAVPFLTKSKNLEARWSELLDLTERTDITPADADMHMQALMLEAVTAQQRGLVKHADDFFTERVSKFKFAKQRSKAAGTLGQIVLERTIDKALWDDAVRMLGDVTQVRKWYHNSHALVERLFREQADVTLLDGSKINPADLTYQLLAATSFLAGPRDNWSKTMGVFQRFDDLPKKDFTRLTAAMKKVTSGKITLEDAFSEANLGKTLRDQFKGAGGMMFPLARQYSAEILSGHTIDKWTTESITSANDYFGGSKPDRAKAVEFIESNHPGLIDRIGEDAAVKEFWGRQHRAKIITFWDNLADPENSLGVTMDTQMERLVGEEMPISQPKKGPANDAWIRHSQAIRDLADDLSESMGEKVLPHEVQAVFWVFAKDEVTRLQQGHFRAMAQDAADQVAEGTPIVDSSDPVLQWIDEASEPYVTEGQRHVRRHRIMRDETEPPARQPLPISHTRSPLDYGGAEVMRMEIREPGGARSTDMAYFDDPERVAFIDYTPNFKRPGETYIHFVSVRPEARGSGYARQLADELYKITGKDEIDWGKIEATEMEVLRQKMAAAHPDKGNYGKPGAYEIDGAKRYFSEEPANNKPGTRVLEEDVVYRPGWGSSDRAKTVGLFDKRRVQWLATREKVNDLIVAGDTDSALALVNKYTEKVLGTPARSGGLMDAASGADFFGLWMDDKFHSPGYVAATNSLNRLPEKPGELPRLMQQFKEKALGEYVPQSDSTRASIRLFESGNFGTLVHENGHALRTMLNPAEMRTVERVYGIKDGVWKVAHEEDFANDLVRYMQTGKAPKSMETSFARVREVLAQTWDLVRGTFQKRRVHPELASIFEDWLDPAATPVPEGLLGFDTAPEVGTMQQIAARPPKFAQPPAKSGDFYTSGRQGQRALATVEKLAVRKKTLAASAAKSQKLIDDVETVLREKRLPSEIERAAHIDEASRLTAKVMKRLETPSISRTPARWQPMLEQVRALAKEAETSPELLGALEDLPQTLLDIQNIAEAAGFDPQHVRNFTPAQVKRLVWGSMRLGNNGDVLHEATAGTRKTRTGALTRAGAVDHSLESLLAATVEAVQEKRTNAVVTHIEQHVSRRLPAGAEIPDGWVLWDPIKTFLYTGEEVSSNVRKAVQTSPTDGLIIPNAVAGTLNRFSKDFDHWAFRAVSKVTSPWRTLVLTLSPGWYVRNIVGNFVLAEAEGVRLADWKKAWGSYRNKDEIGRFADLPFVTSDTLAQEAGVYADDSLIPQSGIKEAMGEGGKVRGAAGYASRRLLRINEVVDEFARSAVYHQGRRLNMTPEQAWTKAKEALVDYNAMSPFERQAVRAVIPFYAWQKGILKVTMNQVIDHPARVAVMQQLGVVQDEYLKERFGVDEVPGYYKTLVGDVNVGSYNPFADPGGLLTVEGITRSMNPFIELGVREGLGAPEFYSDQRRLGYFGQVQQDPNTPEELQSMLTNSPGGRIIQAGLGPQTIGLQTVEGDELTARFQKAQRTLYGMPQLERPPNPYLPSRG